MFAELPTCSASPEAPSASLIIPEQHYPEFWGVTTSTNSRLPAVPTRLRSATRRRVARQMLVWNLNHVGVRRKARDVTAPDRHEQRISRRQMLGLGGSA